MKTCPIGAILVHYDQKSFKKEKNNLEPETTLFSIPLQITKNSSRIMLPHILRHPQHTHLVTCYLIKVLSLNIQLRHCIENCPLTATIYCSYHPLQGTHYLSQVPCHPWCKVVLITPTKTIHCSCHPLGDTHYLSQVPCGFTLIQGVLITSTTTIHYPCHPLRGTHYSSQVSCGPWCKVVPITFYFLPKRMRDRCK